MALYDHASASPTTRFQAYQQSVNTCWNWAVWLWNNRKDLALAEAIFRWILHEASIMQDYDTVDSMEDNLR